MQVHGLELAGALYCPGLRSGRHLCVDACGGYGSQGGKTRCRGNSENESEERAIDNTGTAIFVAVPVVVIAIADTVLQSF